MNLPTTTPRSPSSRASWIALGLAIGCAAGLLLAMLVAQAVTLERASNGVLVAFLPRAVLVVLWAGEALAVVVGIVSLFLILRRDVESKAVIGIVARSLIGIAVGLCGTLILWLIVGHVVIGF